MSIISNYWRYFANVDTTADFKSAIDDIYKWFFRKLWERGMAYMSYTENLLQMPPFLSRIFRDRNWASAL